MFPKPELGDFDAKMMPQGPCYEISPLMMATSNMLPASAHPSVIHLCFCLRCHG